MAVAAILLGLSNLSNLYNIGQRIVIAGSPPTIGIIVYCLIIHARMSSPFPHRATSSLNFPVHQLLAPPALPSLGDCFPCGSVDLGKYFLYSLALSRRARWHTLLVMSLGGAGLSLFGIGYVADNNVDTSDFRPKEKKTQTQRYIYARRDTEDGPLETILPQESLCYRFYV